MRILTSKGGETYQASYVRRVWKYQRGNQNPYIGKEQTTQKDKQRSTKHTHKLVM